MERGKEDLKENLIMKGKKKSSYTVLPGIIKSSEDKERYYQMYLDDSQSTLAPQEDEISYWTWIKEWTINSFPVIWGLLFETLFEVINLIFIGNLNNPTLIAGLGLGTLMVNVAGISVSTGLWGGIDTLVSQDFGNKKYNMWGIHLNRWRILMILIFIPQVLVFANTSYILQVFGQEPQVAEAAAQYTKIMIPGVFFFNLFEVGRRFLNAQLIFTPPSKIQLFVLILHFFIMLIFVEVLDLSITGAAIATWITYFLGIFP